MIRNKVSMEFPSLPENVALARVLVAALASSLAYTIHDLDDIKVAVSEAVSNAILHAYEDKPDGVIRITGTLTDAGLEIMIEDQGKGIPDVDRAMQASYSTRPDRMGLGFVFMQSLMDDLEVFSRPGLGTQVRMFKSWPLANQAVQ